MVQKEKIEKAEPKRARGRPRAFDAENALARARDTFWQSGYSATTLDDLSAAMGMNRPSLYGAFGDKRALYLATLERYVEVNRAAMDAALSGEHPLDQALLHVYDLALGLYFHTGSVSTGCLLTGTAVVEAVNDEAVRTILGDGLRTFDRSFEARFVRAQQSGELDPSTDPAMLAKIASAILHTLAVRSRAGDKRSALRATAEAGVAMICTAGSAVRKK
ncbi:TetR/AcrR family transcriptional regulator [Trinickia acidisoli]|uniref:TetR/AcrR family transcriptional regulator n=1 Tax=Trinickia acidisoli TaxID=2767482 RepID=UPI001A8F618B|nr:TetR/AcrR family transcriptional regulator [Trinickia acidisoli]